jgi:pimeloyl-ACP methyl ester carboxylesterase
MKKQRRDEWSIEKTITDAGYPFEKYSVETYDGYLLDLYRIPRKESSRVVMFQHGMMDSAYGWVLKGDESAAAFAAYDRGFDVFLANFRGATPRKCKAGASKTFWKYSINEIGMYDITASVGKIHCLKQEKETHEEREKEKQPYKLCVVGHSLGGAALLVYLSTAARLCKEHHIHRMILLSPAGVHHHHLPLLARILCAVDSILGLWLKRLNFGMTVYGSVLRVGAQKVAVDVSSLPGLQGLFNIFCRILVGGDESFGGEIMAPYMTPFIQSMPGICWGIVRHGHQLVKAKRFVLYDYGSEVENLKHYGTTTPPRVLDELSQLSDSVPIDFVAGKKDGVVPPENVYELFRDLKRRDVQVSYREFNLGHLHFTFDPSEEFTNYLLSRCCIV